MKASRFVLTLVFAVLFFWLGGCDDQAQRPAPMTNRRLASMKVTIVWPDDATDTRLIPAATTMVTVVITDAGGFIDAKSAARPTGAITSVFTFEALPVGEVTVTATADAPSPDGTMCAVAKVTSTQSLHAGTNNAYFSMVSTVASLQITAPTTSIAVGQSIQLGIEARDAGGQLLKIAPSALRWTSSATGNVRVDSNGLATGVMPGTQAIITVRDTESTRTNQLLITVLVAGG